MTSLRVHNLSVSRAETVLFESLTFELTQGWCGLVGANGAGKSTLLEVLAGQLAPDAGQVGTVPRNATVVLCPQRVEAPPATDDLSGPFAAWVARLGLDFGSLERWPTLSAGERKRWQLAHALAQEAAVLLLDEPTNHLDPTARALVFSALCGFRGVGVVVSHDRGLLDQLTTTTLRLHGGHGEWREGCYSRARDAWEREHATRYAEQTELKRRLTGALGTLQDKASALQRTSAQRSAGRRMRTPHDSDARGLGADFRVEMAQKAHAAALRRTGQQVRRLEAQLDALEWDLVPGALTLPSEPCPRPLVATFDGPVTVEGRRLLSPVHLDVPRGRRLVIEGPNGVGKSTLLSHVLRSATLPDDKVLSLPQELTMEEAADDLEQLRELDRQARGRVLQLVAALGADPERLLRTGCLSPGEARKLRLAFGLARGVWLAVLDEPTNHLDLPSVERLQDALVAFPGAMLLVTHDEALAQAVAHERWVVADGQLTRR